MRAASALLALLLVLTGCVGGAGAARSGVVVTTNILGDITRNVVGAEAEVTVLMKPNANPHSFGISAQEAARLESAGLVVYNGLGLEEGVLRNVRTAAESGVPTLPVGEQVDPIRFGDAATNDMAGQADPHFWTDPERVRAAVRAIADRVTEHVDGVDERVIRANAARYLGELEALHDDMSAEFGRIPAERRRLVTNHHVFGYLARRYDFDVLGAVIPSGTTLASPSASDLKSLADTIRRAGVRTVFADSAQPDRLARVLAEQAGLRVEVVPLFSESLTEPGQGAATYLEMMRANTEAIADGLVG
ncbi:zinc ABC transporter substrate-binding protein AztC [Qaidamihabitans albus]|uniref:zinc ABC transporter substrate-binding protein AztC n=1 Tax=Qaidamihabitans albus TaxID=2795733 RepID=UPI0018F23F35|nr:zinc ABC transporter substrate-binding protein AztC [Qaidamihabitans albus]